MKEKASKKEGGEKVVGRKVLDRRECQLVNKYRRNDRVTKSPSSTPNGITDSGKKDH